MAQPRAKAQRPLPTGTKSVAPLGQLGATNTEKVAFLENNLQYALQIQQSTRINFLAALSQAALESDWGTSRLATTGNNIFSLTSRSGGIKHQTNSYWSGDEYAASTGFYFRKYSNRLNSFLDWARIISTLSYYTDVYSVAMNFCNYVHEISKSPYISECGGDSRDSYQRGLLAIGENIVNIGRTHPRLSNLNLPTINCNLPAIPARPCGRTGTALKWKPMIRSAKTCRSCMPKGPAP